MKKVLIISYHFAPSGSTGGIRALKFVKYLRDFGWEPVVLTSRNGFDFGIDQDEKLVEQIPSGVKVYRTWSLEIHNWYWNWNRKKKKDSKIECKVLHADTGNVPKRAGFSGFKKFIINLFIWPDCYAGWIPFALLQGLFVIWKEKVDLIFVTYPPVSSFYIGFWLSLMTGKKIVADYRDPILAEKGAVSWIDRHIVEHSTMVIVTSDVIAQIYIARYQQRIKDKLKVITNGYDESDAPQVDRNKLEMSHSLRFIHAGFLYSSEGVAELLAEVLKVIEEHPDIVDNVSFLFVGSRPDCPEFDALEKLDLAREINRVSRKECLDLVLSSHVIMAFLPKHLAAAGCIPSKIFDAMLLRKPVLSVMAEGAAQQLIRVTQLGDAILPNMPQQIRLALLRFYEAHKNQTLEQFIDEQKIRPFSRKYLTGQLADIFEEVIKKP